MCDHLCRPVSVSLWSSQALGQPSLSRSFRGWTVALAVLAPGKPGRLNKVLAFVDCAVPLERSHGLLPPPPRAGAFRSAALTHPGSCGFLQVSLPALNTMPDAEGEPVQLFVYDLSGGMARAFSQVLLGRTVSQEGGFSGIGPPDKNSWAE